MNISKHKPSVSALRGMLEIDDCMFSTQGRLHHNQVFQAHHANFSNDVINLLSMYKLCINNHVFVEFYPDILYFKDQTMRKVVLQGTRKGGVYRLYRAVQSNFSIHKSMTSITMKASMSRSTWHDRFGHPSYAIVTKALTQNHFNVFL